MKRCLAMVLLLCLFVVLPGRGQFEPPAANVPDAATRKAIEAKTAELARRVAALAKGNQPDDLLAEVEIYLKAAEWMLQHKEYYHKDAGKWTLAILDEGLNRAGLLERSESPWRYAPGQDVSRAYRSRVDGSVQPYSIALPLDYGKDKTKKWRLDVVLHGRDSSISEVKFLNQHNGKATPKDQPFVRLDIYGRGNNAYRWAGETDVHEAIAAFLAAEKKAGRDLIDPRRIVLRGFSMGGAGTWHLGLHHPDRWCVLGPGAGFTTTHGYIKG
ncbi:MAG: hypothetical protein AB7K24_27090, partial [Gemmataceae bacterium]